MLGGQWITDNWKDLEGWAKCRHQTEWRELLVHYSFWVHKNWHTFSALPELDKIKFTRTWFKNNVAWSKSDFRKSIDVNNLPEDYSDLISDDGYNDWMEIRAEDVDESIVDWMIDIHNNWSERDAKRLIHIRKIYLELPLHQKVLYDMYFTRMMSLRDIGTKLNLPHLAIWTMVKELKKTIEEKCNGI